MQPCFFHLGSRLISLQNTPLNDLETDTTRVVDLETLDLLAKAQNIKRKDLVGED